MGAWGNVRGQDALIPSECRLPGRSHAYTGIMIIATHNGKFHADDVFGVTLLLQLYPDAKVVRTRDPERLAQADIVLDVGGVYDVEHRRFDHHQNTSGARANGIYYSAFGLLWQNYGMRLCNNNRKVWKRVDQILVQSVDAIDNGQDLYTVSDFGVRPVTVSDAIGWFTPLTASGDEHADDQFFVAVKLATKLLLRIIEKARDAEEGERIFLDAYAASPDRRYVVLDRFVPHGHIAVKQPGLLYVLFPDMTGDWRIKTVQASSGSFESRVPLPKPWYGLTNAEFSRVAGIPDGVFCHRTGFIAGAKSKNSIMELLRQALAQDAARPELWPERPEQAEPQQGKEPAAQAEH